VLGPALVLREAATWGTWAGSLLRVTTLVSHHSVTSGAPIDVAPFRRG